jgi:homoserine dehydrogenase
MKPPELSLALIGFGNVGRRFVRLLDEASDRLDFTWRLVAIGTRHHGSVIDANGIDATRAATIVESNHSLDRLDPEPDERSGLDVVRQTAELLSEEANEGRLIVVETTALDIDRGEPARTHVRAALEGLAHVVTANKGPAAFAFAELDALAESVDRVFFFEGAVMDGVPVFNLVRETMPGVVVNGFRGVINTTCHYMLSSMEHGTSPDDAVLDMQARGIAEADPSHDIDGWDAAAKTAALVNVLMGGRISARERAVSPHRSSGRCRDRAAHELADADGLRARQRPVTHQSAAARAVASLSSSKPTTT